MLRHLTRSEGGFSLMEILVVVVIIGILVTLVAVNIAGKPSEARIVKAQADIGTIEQALDYYKMDNDVYPSTEQGLRSLIKKPTVGRIPTNWNGPYLKSSQVPDDPWGNPYQYLNPGLNNTHSVDVWSMGPDGETGGESSEDDVTPWQDEDEAEE